MTVVMRGSLEVAVLLLGLVRMETDSANFSSCLLLLSSSLGGILMLILSGCPSLLVSLRSLWSDVSPSKGPQSLWSATSCSSIWRLYSSVGSMIPNSFVFCCT